MLCYIDGEVNVMSVAVGVCGEDFFTLIADSRKTKYDRNGECPADEQFKKLFRINGNVIFAMTGIFLDESEIHRPFEGIDTTSVDVDVAANAVIGYYNRRAPYHPVNQSYIIGGRNSAGDFVAYSVKYEVGGTPVVERWHPTGGHALLISLPPALVADGEKYREVFGACITSSTEHDEMVRKVGVEIAKISAIDITVNANIQTMSVF